MEDQVVSFDLAKKLKDLGVKQGSVWYWVYTFPPNIKLGLAIGGGCWLFDTDFYTGTVKTGGDPISAFTVSELGELLPEMFTDNSAGNLPHINKADGFWQIDYPPNGKVFAQFGNEADARAAMLIWLTEN